MNKMKSVLTIVFLGLIFISVIAMFLFWALPLIDSKTMVGILGVVIGSFITFLGTFLATIVGVWGVTKDVEARLKDRISRDALELTRMDYELRSKGLKRFYLAPVKVYRELYKALLELHTAGTWPKAIEKLGILQIFELGKEEEQKGGDES